MRIDQFTEVMKTPPFPDMATAMAYSILHPDVYCSYPDAPQSFTAMFTIVDESGHLLHGATVIFDGTALEGDTAENLVPATYPYSITLEGYKSATGDVIITDENVTVNVVLEEDNDIVLVYDGILSLPGLLTKYGSDVYQKILAVYDTVAWKIEITSSVHDRIIITGVGTITVDSANANRLYWETMYKTSWVNAMVYTDGKFGLSWGGSWGTVSDLQVTFTM